MEAANAALAVAILAAGLLGCSSDPGRPGEGASPTSADATPVTYPPTETIPRHPPPTLTPQLAGRTFLLTGSNAATTQPALALHFDETLLNVRIDCGGERVIAPLTYRIKPSRRVVVAGTSATTTPALPTGELRVDSRARSLCGGVTPAAHIEQDAALMEFLSTSVRATLDGNLLTLQHTNTEQFLELQLQARS